MLQELPVVNEAIEAAEPGSVLEQLTAADWTHWYPALGVPGPELEAGRLRGVRRISPGEPRSRWWLASRSDMTKERCKGHDSSREMNKIQRLEGIDIRHAVRRLLIVNNHVSDFAAVFVVHASSLPFDESTALHKILALL